MKHFLMVGIFSLLALTLSAQTYINQGDATQERVERGGSRATLSLRVPRKANSTWMGVHSDIYRSTVDSQLYTWNPTSGTDQLIGGSTAANVFVNNGNSFTADAVIGTNDAFGIVFRAGNTNRFRISNVAGQYRLLNEGSSSFGIMDLGASGDGIIFSRSRPDATPVLISNNTNNTSTGNGFEVRSTISSVAGLRMSVAKDGNIEILGAGGGIFLKSPDGTRYKITVANGGTIAVTAAP